MSSCNCIIMSFSCLIEPYASFPDFDYQSYTWAWLMSSQAEPFYILCSLISHFLPRGYFPPSVIILHMFPCIENRYVPFPGTSFPTPDTRLLQDMYYKELLFFFELFKISENFQKKSKNQKSGQEKMLSLVVVESCHLRTEHYISHPLVGLVVWL